MRLKYNTNTKCLFNKLAKLKGKKNVTCDDTLLKPSYKFRYVQNYRSCIKAENSNLSRLKTRQKLDLKYPCLYYNHNYDYESYMHQLNLNY